MRCKHCGVPVIWMDGKVIHQRRGWFAQPEAGRTGFRCHERPWPEDVHEPPTHEAEFPDMTDRVAIEEWLNG